MAHRGVTHHGSVTLNARWPSSTQQRATSRGALRSRQRHLKNNGYRLCSLWSLSLLRLSNCGFFYQAEAQIPGKKHGNAFLVLFVIGSAVSYLCF